MARLLPPGSRTDLAQWLAERKVGASPVQFPIDFSGAEAVLIILPESPLEALLQMSNVMALMALFNGKRVTFFGERRVVGYFKTLANVSAVEYGIEERSLFAPAFSAHIKALHSQGFGVCVLLEKQPDLALLYLTAQTGAGYRIGYASSGEYPFLNLRVRGASGKRHAAEANAVLSRTLGAPPQKPAKWSVAREHVEEVRQLLRDLHVPDEARLVVVDAVFMHQAFGPDWTRSLVERLKGIPGLACCCIADESLDEASLAWLRNQGLVIVPPLTVTRTAALLHLSAQLIAGNSSLFQLACLMHAPSTGLFEQNALQEYFRPAPYLRSVAYTAAPDGLAIAAVAATLEAPPPPSGRPKSNVHKRNGMV